MFIKFHKSRKAQTTAEYGILIGVVIAAILAMQYIVKRALMGRIFDGTNNFVTTTGGTGNLPANISVTTDQSSNQTSNLAAGATTVNSSGTSNRTENY